MRNIIIIRKGKTWARVCTHTQFGTLTVVGGYVGGREQGVIAIMRREVEIGYSDACVHTVLLTVGDCTGIPRSQ